MRNRNPLLWLVLFAVLPVYALGQRDDHRNQNPNGHRVQQGQRGERQAHPRGERRERGEVRQRGERRERGEVRGQRRGEQRGEIRGRERGERRGEVRGRGHRGWDGRRFERSYFDHHYGRGHHFRWDRCRWSGPRFYIGSFFLYGDFWFVIVDPVPPYWYGGDVYVEDMDGNYYILNPMYPGIAIRVNVYIP